jgi:hypothetical protein
MKNKNYINIERYQISMGVEGLEPSWSKKPTDFLFTMTYIVAKYSV